jgi:hypothetical protein
VQANGQTVHGAVDSSAIHPRLPATPIRIKTMARTRSGKAILNGIPDNAMRRKATEIVTQAMIESGDPQAMADGILEALCYLHMFCSDGANDKADARIAKELVKRTKLHTDNWAAYQNFILDPS